ncbi:MAG: hypothetical protein MK033_11165 [Candidatus Caenarcaniphilales bacterium]|nr:hypothetical protein [Candidatus Caenarcaniphilales bacterium]
MKSDNSGWEPGHNPMDQGYLINNNFPKVRKDVPANNPQLSTEKSRRILENSLTASAVIWKNDFHFSTKMKS